MKKTNIIALLTLTLMLISTLAEAHPGRTNKNGCHRDKQTHSRHCHR